MGAVVIFDAIANLPAATLYNTRFFFYATDTGNTYVSDGSMWQQVNVIGSGGVASFNGRTGVVVPVDGDYYGVVAAALTGATSASRYVGATTSGAPVSGTFLTGDFVVDQTGAIWICTAGGTPGTWVEIGAGGSLPSWFQFGSGSPVGTVTPSQQGALYQDFTNGALYEALSTTDTSWILTGGNGDRTVCGVWTDGSDVLITTKNGAVGLSDAAAGVGTGNQAYWDSGGADGAQSLKVLTGPSGEFLGILQDPAGNMTVPGTVENLGQILDPVTVEPTTVAGKTQLYMLDNGDGTYTLKANVNGNVASLASG